VDVYVQRERTGSDDERSANRCRGLTTYAYYANDDADAGKRGNVATITQRAGHVTQVTAYNADGRALTIVDPNGLTDDDDLRHARRLTRAAVGGETTTYDYDFAGQPHQGDAARQFVPLV